MKDRMRAISALEDALGTNWFAKLGGIMVVIGVTTIGLIKLQSFGAAGKAIVSYLVAFLLLAGGIFLEKRERYQLLGRVGIGCGWALLFGSTYGIHNFPAMRILDSLVLDCILMLVVALAMAAHTLRYKSQFVTGLSFLLGYTTIALSFSEITSGSSAGASESTVYGLLAGVMLAIGLVTIVLKMGWFELEVFGILSSYLNHLYWLYKILGPNGAHGRAFPEYHASIAMLFFYWLTFRISYILRGVKTDFEEHVSTVSALLNTLLLLGVMKFQSVQPDLAYLALFAIGALEFIFAQLPITRRRRRAFIILSLLGAALMIVAVPSHFSGNDVAYLWLVGAEVFLFAGIIFEEVVFLRVGLFTGLLVGIDLLVYNFRPLVAFRAKTEDLASGPGILFAVCGVALYLNSLYIATRWKESFRAALDRRLLDIHSYLAAFATATAAWALFSKDWTAVAFAALMLALAALGPPPRVAPPANSIRPSRRAHSLSHVSLQSSHRGSATYAHHHAPHYVTHPWRHLLSHCQTRRSAATTRSSASSAPSFPSPVLPCSGFSSGARRPPFGWPRFFSPPEFSSRSPLAAGIFSISAFRSIFSPSPPFCEHSTTTVTWPAITAHSASA